MKYNTLFLTFVVACVFVSFNVFAKDPLSFAVGYVEHVHSDTSPKEFSEYWRQRAQKYMHNTEEGLKKEYDLAVAIHDVIEKDNTLKNEAEANDWGDDVNTITYTFDLNTPIPNAEMPEQISALASEDTVWTQYQITIEKENSAWVVSGETFVGAPQ